MALRHLAYRKLGTHRGSRRVWLEGRRLTDIGFDAGVRYQATSLDGALHLRLSVTGDHVVSGTGARPIVDLLTKQLPPVERIEVRFLDGEVRVSLHPADRATLGRLSRINTRLESGLPLRMGSLCHGAGVTSDALLRGLQSTGTPAQLEFALELDGAYLEQSLGHNPQWHSGAMSVEGSLDEVQADVLPFVELLEAGLPCTAASKAGRSKHGHHADDDEKTAHLVYGFLRIIEATQPAVIVLENVEEYATTASATIIRGQLAAWGYDIQEATIQGQQYALEARARLVLVATTQGFTFDLAQLQPVEARPATMAEVLEPVALDDASWRTTGGLDAKEARDIAKGSGFRQYRVTPESTRVHTIRRLYMKAGSTDVRVTHPVDATRSRLLTPGEHARCKGVNPQLVAGVSDTVAHQLLGQSVIAPAFVALGALLAEQVAPFVLEQAS